MTNQPKDRTRETPLDFSGSGWRRPSVVFAIVLAAGIAQGRVELLAPEDGVVLPSVPAAQRAAMALR